MPLLFNNSNLIRHNSHFSGTRWWNATDRSSFSLFHSFIFFPFVSIVFFTSSSPFSASKKQNNNSMIFQTRSSRHLVGHNRPFPVQLQTVFSLLLLPLLMIQTCLAGWLAFRGVGLVEKGAFTHTLSRTEIQKYRLAYLLAWLFQS